VWFQGHVHGLTNRKAFDQRFRAGPVRAHHELHASDVQPGARGEFSRLGADVDTHAEGRGRADIVAADTSGETRHLQIEERHRDQFAAWLSAAGWSRKPACWHR
jgi:hypothetical protein